jgi:hypothetical protein
MQIYSPFHDYYDIGLSMGSDPLHTFNRKTYVVELSKDKWGSLFMELPRYVYLRYKNSSEFSSVYSEVSYLFFCGSIFSTIHISDYPKPNAPVFFNTWQTIEDYFVNSKNFKGSFGQSPKGSVNAVRKVEEIKINSDVFEEVGAPYFIISTPELVDLHRVHTSKQTITIKANPNLKDLGLMHRIDPYTCYQTVSTYIGSQLVTVEAPHKATDSEKLHAHGMDDKSFKSVAFDSKKARRKRKRGI